MLYPLGFKQFQDIERDSSQMIRQTFYDGAADDAETKQEIVKKILKVGFSTLNKKIEIQTRVYFG